MARTKIVFDVNIMAELDQLLDGLHMAAIGRAMQWRELICVSDIHLNTATHSSDGVNQCTQINVQYMDAAALRIRC